MKSPQKKTSYAELLQHPKWQRKRLEILSRANFKCEFCEDSGDKPLHVHHSYYERGLAPWEYPDDSLHALCVDCHNTAQATLTELHRQIGRLSLSEIDQLYGYAVGLETQSDHKLPQSAVQSYENAAGIIQAWSFPSDEVIGRLTNGHCAGEKLEWVKRASGIKSGGE